VKLFKDIDEYQFWLTLWGIVACGIVTLGLIFSWSGYQEDLVIKDLVEQGHDTLELSCMFKRSETLETACMLLAQEKLQKTINSK
jgi:hypothetical protein